MHYVALAFITLYILLSASAIPLAAVAHPRLATGTGLRGDYYDDLDFTNLKLTRLDPVVNFNWAKERRPQRWGPTRSRYAGPDRYCRTPQEPIPSTHVATTACAYG